jgi:acyl carrier protein
MTSTSCAEDIKQIICEKLVIQAPGLSENLSFSQDLAIDSLDFCEVVWEIEKRFKLTIPDEALEKINTVGQLIAYVEDRAAA